ncbi:transcriptional protein SWT1-like isoform X2 [Halichondria panicea]|uniref:transcriptional protein SWT1-like isoform X2 n=1 Tax=Halichondria panicea TaxID=6063 RepID=UPI00312B6E4F
MCTVQLQMEETHNDWMKVASHSRPGVFYYFNKATKESKWKLPQTSKAKVSKRDENVKVKVTQSAAIPRSSQSLPHTRVTTSHAGLGSKGLVSNSTTVPVLRISQSLQPKSSSGRSNAGTGTSGRVHLQTNSNNCMETVSPDLWAGEEEAMEVEERWGDDDDVIDMDVDMSEEEQMALISEIHTTRNDLPLATSVGSVTQKAPFSLTNTKLYLVLDTNILISHLGFLRELKDYAIKNVGRPVLVVPWVVMQELDALKTRSSSRLAGKARDAIRFLNDSFSAEHPRIRGQTMEEVHTELNNIAISNNDDRILHCCLLYQEKVKVHGGVVVLFSNDVQLCSKAMVNQVKALNRKTLLNDLRTLFKGGDLAPVVSSQGQSHGGHAHYNPPPALIGAHQVSATPPPAAVPVTRAEVEDLLCEAERVMGTALSAAIREEFVKAYGADLWQDILRIKPPWKLQDTVTLIDKHWIAVFRDPLPPGIQFSCVAGLLQHVKSRDRMVPTVGVLDDFTSKATALLRAFANVSGYDGVLPQSIAQLASVSERISLLKARGLATTQRRHVTSHVTTPNRLGLFQRTSSGGSLSTTPTSPTSPLGQPLPLITKLLRPSCDDLLRLVGAQPPTPLEQLEWVIGIIKAISEQCCGRIFYAINNNPQSLSDKQEASIFLSQLLVILKSTTTAINNLLVCQTTTREDITQMLISFDTFLNTTMGIHSPLTLQGFTHCVQMDGSKVQQMLIQALGGFSARVGALEQLPRELGL